METVDRIYRILEKKDLSDFIVTIEEADTDQIRFSAGSKDLFNHWEETAANIFIAKGKKIFSSSIRRFEKPEDEIEKAISILNALPDNENYFGLHDRREVYSGIKKFSKIEADIDSFASSMLDSAMNAGADRASGLVYNHYSTISFRTPTNESSYNKGGLHLLIRAFRGEGTGQEATHFGFGNSRPGKVPDMMGNVAAETAKLSMTAADLEPGKFSILMGPHLVGNLLTYGSSLFSAHSVDSGMSCFEGKIGSKVAGEGITLHDDPLNFNGDSAVQIDDEGVPTSNTPMIVDGILKTYLHSHSTAVKFKTETNGHAGVISPHPWQLNLSPGRGDWESMLSEMKHGLFIKNAWYTRFQDYRNGVFSTVPRDGVFIVENGEIKGSVRGIRISDSIPDILNNIESVSKDQRNVRWWEEIASSFMPYAMVNSVSISKAF